MLVWWYGCRITLLVVFGVCCAPGRWHLLCQKLATPAHATVRHSDTGLTTIYGIWNGIRNGIWNGIWNGMWNRLGNTCVAHVHLAGHLAICPIVWCCIICSMAVKALQANESPPPPPAPLSVVLATLVCGWYYSWCESLISSELYSYNHDSTGACMVMWKFN